MSAGLSVHGDIGNFDLGHAPTDLTDSDGNPVEMENNVLTGGLGVEATWGGWIGGSPIGIFGRLDFNYLWGSQKYSMEVFAPAECDKFIEGGVGNVGSAGNCGTGKAVDADRAVMNRANVSLTLNPRVRLWEDRWTLYTGGIAGLSLQPFSPNSRALLNGTYGASDLLGRTAFVYGAEVGTETPYAFLGGDIRIALAFLHSSGATRVSDAGGDTSNSLHGTHDNTIRLSFGLYW